MGSRRQGASVGFRMIGGKGNVLYVHGMASSVIDQVSYKAYQDALKTLPGHQAGGRDRGRIRFRDRQGRDAEVPRDTP